MERTLRSLILLMLTASASGAQAQGTPTFVPSAEIESVLRANEARAVTDQVLRLVPVEGDYNVAVSVVRRSKVDGRTRGAPSIRPIWAPLVTIRLREGLLRRNVHVSPA